MRATGTCVVPTDKRLCLGEREREELKLLREKRERRVKQSLHSKAETHGGTT